MTVRISTGTGFAHPKTKPPPIPSKRGKKYIVKGTIIVPTKSTCKSGLIDKRPAFFAVISPYLYAIKPCIISWPIIATIRANTAVMILNKSIESIIFFILFYSFSYCTFEMFWLFQICWSFTHSIPTNFKMIIHTKIDKPRSSL